MQIKTGSQFLVLTLFLAVLAFPASAQSRDNHLTPQEVELIQEAQVLDKRIEIFIKAAERRMLVLAGTQAADPKQMKKDAQAWGELPTGSRAELLEDVAKILEEAITNIDDVSMHDEKNPLLAKALRKLAAAANQIAGQLTPLREQAKTAAELGSIEQALENSQMILDAANKLPPANETEKGKGKTKKPN